MICNECETVAHCSKYGCIPKQPAQLPFGVKGCLVAIKTLLSRDPRVHANTAIQMIDALLANEALDKMAKNARELGLDYEPAQHPKAKAMKLEPCGGCYGSGWITRDPDIGTDQECFVCGGSGACPKEPEQEPVAIKYWLQDTMESGRWVTTDNMAKATAEKMLSGEYGDVYPQGRIVEPSPPAQQKPLTDWIAVSHRIPLESDGEVLVRMRDGRCEIAWATYWHGASNAFAQWTYRDPDEDEAPTHWMRIPTIEAKPKE